MKLSSNYRLIGILLLPVVLFTVIFFIIRKPTISLIRNSNFTIENFTDIDEKGTSESIVAIKNNEIDVRYSLHNGFTYPYAGMQIQHKNAELFSIDGYDLKLKIETGNDFRISIRLNQYIPNYSNVKNPMSFLILVKTIGLKKGENNITIQTKDINEIPDWWINKNQKKANDLKSISLQNTKNIWFISDYSTLLNQEIRFKIKELTLTYNYLPYLYLTLIISLFYYAILWVLWKFKKEKIKYIFMPIEMTKVSEKVPKSQAEILAFIGSNYQNPDLRLFDVSRHVGLSEDATSDLLKKYSQKNFRQYLNQIRMEEAKRLLKETNLQIAEIAFKVGYNNIQHFNRVFKEYTDESPKNFREIQA
jgi:AraC-like DNA-binding protein